MKKLIFLIFSLVFFQDCFSQELRKVVSKISLAAEEHYYLLSDKKTRQGEYCMLLAGDTIQSGQYTEGKKSGEWRYARKGKTEFIYNFDTGRVVTDTLGKARGVIFSEGSTVFRMLLAMNVVYPVEAQMRKQTGTVLVSLTIDVDGTAKEIVLEKGCGFPILDKEALRAISKIAEEYPWHPAINAEGEKVKTTIVRPVQFVQ